MSGHQDHDVHRALADAFTAGNAQGLVDHVDALRILGNGVLRADACAFAALDAGEILELSVAEILEMNAGVIRIVLFIECQSTCPLAAFTSRAIVLIDYCKLLHFPISFSAACAT